MLVLKSFVTHSQFVANEPNTVAVFGEMSTESATYARDIGHYDSATTPKLGLHSFFCKLDGVAVAVPTQLVEHVLGVVDYVYAKTISSTSEIFSDVLLAELLEDFATSAENFNCGEIVTDGTHFVPEWLAWRAKNVSGVGTNEIRVWLADESFRLQYDEFEIVVVPPTDTLDNFFRTGTEVELMLKGLDITTQMQRVQDARADYPYTIAKNVSYDYVDPFLSTHRVPSHWALLIYGSAGNNVDSIADALIEYILANSSHTREEWTNILPDLFRRTEFLIIPSWFQYAISPRKTEPGGVYLCAVTPKQVVQRIKEVAPAYTDAHINENAMTLGHPYGSLSLIAVGSPDNRDAKFKLTDIYPDYLSLSPSSLDFNRMAQATKDWLTTLHRQLVEAETLTEFSSVPRGMTRSKRNGHIFLVTNVGNINYLVSARANYADEFSIT